MLKLMPERLEEGPGLSSIESRQLSGQLSALILVLLAGSGCAALIYEVVWFQQLQLVIGSSAVSLGLLLATYMGGLFLGSVALPRLIPAGHHPLHLYGLLELGTAILGILILSGLPYVGAFYITSAAQGFPNVLLRGIMAAVCLLPPTILMGATFPILSRWLEPTRSGVSWMGLFYGANIAGAVIGCLWSGFYLLRVYDLATTTYVAVGMNAVVALASFGLAPDEYRAPAHGVCKERDARAREGTAIYIAIALSGLSALGAQVVWTRLLSVLFGTTVYSFSIILAVFLVGLGIGSGVGAMLARWTERPQLIFGLCQVILAASIAWTAWVIAKSLPYWPVDAPLALSPWFNFQFDLFRALWTILPATVLWGVSFPLALASLAAPAQDPGRLAARVYGANTLGAIVGALVFTFALVPGWGTMHSQQVLIVMPCVAALILLAPLCLRPAGQPYREPHAKWHGVMTLGIFLAFASVLIGTVSEIPWQVIAYGRRVALMMYSDREQSKTRPMKLLYRGEGLNSSVAVTDQSGLRTIYVNGNSEASNADDDLRLERMAGHLPALIQSNARDVLIVGFGAGVTAGSFVTHREVKRIVIAELESLIPPVSGRFFRQENYGVAEDPRTTLFYDDGRHYLLTHEDRFDVITSDPVHLWVRGTSALYSKEYFELVRRHLQPGGAVAQWLPLYDGDVETIRSVMATFFEVFPNGTVWSNHNADRGYGYDLVLVGQAAPSKINVDELQRRLDQPDDSAVVGSLRAVGFNSAIDILATYLGQASDLKPWLAGAQINLDRNLRLQYLAGFDINSHTSEEIYQLLLAQRRFPGTVLVGSDGYMRPLRSLLRP
jgi:spermidine synthase